MFNFRKSKAEVTSLNLETPAIAAEAQPAAAVKNPDPQRQAPSQGPRIQDEINRRTLELAKSGKHPETIFFLVQPSTRTPVSLKSTNPPSNSILLFSRLAAAHFFRRERNPSLEIAGIAFDEFSRAAEDLLAAGIDSFVMDLSPKSSTTTVLRPQGNLITREQITLAWAGVQTTRDFRAQQSLGPLFFNNPEFSSPASMKKLRQVLEILRDSGGYEVPFVHWMIALIAGMQHDEPVRLAATADLEVFGPDFVGKTSPLETGDEIAEWGKSWTQAQLGLLTEFKMINGPEGKPIESMLRTVNVSIAEPPTS